MKILGVIVILILAYAKNAFGNTRLCGAKLDMALLDVCGQTGFNTRLKKSNGKSYYFLFALYKCICVAGVCFLFHLLDALLVSPDIMEVLNPMATLSDVFRSQEENFLAKIRRRRQGIVDECCRLKGCTYSELSQYCSSSQL